MPAGLIRCSQCEHAYPAEVTPEWAEEACPVCRVKRSVLSFPALLGPRPSRKPEAAAGEGQAVCFFHAHKPAAVPCDACGRFLCRLCDFDYEGGHYCAACLESAQAGKAVSGKTADLVREEVFIPQNLALLLSFYVPLSIFGLYVAFLTAPASLYVSIRYWNHREGLQMRGKWPYVVSLVLGLLQILALGSLAALFIWALTRYRNK